MSHVATNWAFAQRGLKPAEKLVLLCLADRHNPDHGGCWPSQDRIALDAEVSRSQLNVHLQSLTKRGLIRREARFDPSTNRQKTTFYVLGFEDGFVADPHDDPDGGAAPSGGGAPSSDGGSVPASGKDEGPCPEKPCPETGHGAVSDLGAEPCPVSGQSRVRKPDTNLVKEPLRRTSKARAREGAPAVGVSELFDKFQAAHPSAAERDAVYRAWVGAFEDGANPARLVVLAHRYRASPEVQRGFSKKAQNWLRDGGWREASPYPERAVRASVDETCKFWAERINSTGYVAASAVSVQVALRMVELGLVTRDQLRARGIAT